MVASDLSDRQYLSHGVSDTVPGAAYAASFFASRS